MYIAISNNISVMILVLGEFVWPLSAIFLLGSGTVPKVWYAIGFFTSIYQHDQAKAGIFINGFNLSTSGKSPTFH